MINIIIIIFAFCHFVIIIIIIVVMMMVVIIMYCSCGAAGNESCPQPQTSEHLAAVEIMKLKHILILQNKIDLVKESQAKEQYEQILAFVKGDTLVFLFFFFCIPSYVWGSPVFGEIFAYVTVSPVQS